MWKWFTRRELIARYVAAADPPAAVRATGVVPGRGAQVSGKCAGLHTYLVNRFADSVVLTFGQLEDLLGGALPDSARAQQEWWTNKDPGTSSCAEAWILAGRTATPNLMARTVTFERREASLRDAQVVK